MVLVLLPVTDEEPVLPPAALAALARLGVTSVSLLRDEESAGIVLEGWARLSVERGSAGAGSVHSVHTAVIPRKRFDPDLQGCSSPVWASLPLLTTRIWLGTVGQVCPR